MTCFPSGECQTCMTGFSLQTSNNVTGCYKNCPTGCSSSACNQFTGVCSACENEFTLDTIANTCISCTLDNCQACSATNFCASCLPTFNLVNGSCSCPNVTVISSATPPTCVCSNSSLTYNPVNNTCENGCGVANCIACNNSICVTCLQGYVLKNGTCE